MKGSPRRHGVLLLRGLSFIVRQLDVLQAAPRPEKKAGIAKDFFFPSEHWSVQGEGNPLDT